MPVDQPSDSKPFWQSKTFWVNLVMGVGAFVPFVQKHATPEMMTSAFAAVNVVLRFISKDKVTIS